MEDDRFRELTWSDVEEWAGATIVSRGRGYQRAHRVQELARTQSGALVAWVQGSQQYATRVDIEEDRLNSVCTCPYGFACKHAVAVLLEYLEQVKQNIGVPVVAQSDQRLALLQGTATEETEDDGEDESDARSAVAAQPTTHTGALRSYLERQTKDQLVALLQELATSYPAVHKALTDRRELAGGTAARLVKSIRAEIHRLSAKPGWADHWNDAGYVPDYSPVRDRLEALLAKGHADEVVVLGRELLELGIGQVEMSDDEGETAQEIASCLDVVFRALPQSRLSPVEQMVWAAEAQLSDEYDLCDEAASHFWEQEHAAADWSALADKLREQLDHHKQPEGEEDSSSRGYHRDRLSNWLIEALENAGRQSEIIPLCEREARQTGSYVRLVEYLKEDGRLEEAEQWIKEGINATQKRWPGIASNLRAALREIREKGQDWLGVAALRAEEFFERPSVPDFQELQKAAERAGAWPAVRAAAMHYLETGEPAQSNERTIGRRTIPPWPLPRTVVIEADQHRYSHFPMTETLIDIAIAEKQPDEVLRWYDQAGPRAIAWGYSDIEDDRVAEAVAGAYPDRAIAIWKMMAEGHISRAQANAYQAAGRYLRNVQRVLGKLKRDEEWRKYLEGLRQANARKRRLLEVLDGLAGGRIIER